MVNATPQLAPRLVTDCMTEKQFRLHANLCLRCGRAVAELESMNCEECNQLLRAKTFNKKIA